MITISNETWTTILRLIVSCILLYCAFETWRITYLVENRRLIRLTNKLFKSFIVVAFARLIALFLDSLFQYYTIGVFSNIVNNGFYIWIAFMLLRQRRRLQINENIDLTGGKRAVNPRYIDKKKVSELIDDLLDELKIELDAAPPETKNKFNNLHLI